MLSMFLRLYFYYFYFLSSLTHVGILHSSVPDGLIGPRTSVVLILYSSSEFGI
jgi:hypothetical protein